MNPRAHEIVEEMKALAEPTLAEVSLLQAAIQLEIAKKEVLAVIAQWRKEADQYLAQCEEARSKGIPFEMMNATAITLRGCAHDLERAIKK